jgi:NAD(P)-dependent dehydrogenase (short-subunit alcohol dehydrogenase family)
MIKSSFDFADKVVVITGATRGLGRQIAQGFSDAGATIVVVSRKQEACDATVAELGKGAVAKACNVADWEACGALIEGVIERFGKIDVLINNAGMSPVLRRLTDLDEAGFDKIYDTNVKSVYRLSSLAAMHMAKGEGGSIISISSTAAVLAPAPVAPYAGAKAAVEAVSRAVARAYGPKVRSNVIQCGTFRTDLTAGFVDLPEFQKQVAAVNPARRVGSPEEVVGAALYLASASASYTSGAVVKVDGGEA